MTAYAHGHDPGKREELTYRDDLAEAIAIFLSRRDSGEATDELFQYMGGVTAEHGDGIATAPLLDMHAAVTD